MLNRKRVTDIFVGIYEIPHGLIAMIAGKLAGKPVIVNIIGNPAYSKLRKGIRKKITYWLLKQSDICTTTGTNSKAFLVSEGFDPAEIHILPNSIDVEYFTPDNTVKKEYDIINIGRLSPEKRMLDFIRIIAIVQRVIPEIKVAIAGSGPDRQIIEDEIKSLNLSNNINLLGYIKDVDIVKFFNSGKVFMMCSETEGFPRTIIQSMACGTPCVVTDVGDISDLVINGQTGYLIKSPEQHSDFAHHVINLLSDADSRNVISENGLRHVRMKYSHEAASKTWKTIFDQLEGRA